MATKAKKAQIKKAATKKTAAKRGAGAPDVADYGAEELLGYYRDMLLIRRFEEKAGQMYGMGLIGGFCHLYIGQEAVVVGMRAATTANDSVITSYRDHGHMLACGMEAKGVMAELTGRAGGYSKGKGGSMHMFSRDKGFFGGHGIVGAQVPLGTGIAFGHKYRDRDAVCLTYLGDGAVNQGQVYEAFNMAALWDLPVVYVIENNKYAMGTSIERASARTDLFHRGQAYGIPGSQVDGMDVLAVKEAGAKDDLPLPRPLDVGPGQVPLPGGGPEDAPGARPDRAPARRTARRRDRGGDRAQGDRPGGQGGGLRGRRLRPGKSRAGSVRALHRRSRLIRRSSPCRSRS